MPRSRQNPQPAPKASVLLARGITRERALLAERVGTLRLSAQMNWADLAAAAGMNAVQIQSIEEGRRDPQLSSLVSLALALKVHSLDELFGPLPLESGGIR